MGQANRPLPLRKAPDMISGNMLSRALEPPVMRVAKFIVAPYVHMPDGCDAAYRAHTSSKSRYSYERRYMELERTGRVRISVASTAPSLADPLEVAFRLNELRWSGGPDVSDFGRPRRFAFHLEVLPMHVEAQPCPDPDSCAGRQTSRIDAPRPCQRPRSPHTARSRWMALACRRGRG
jgi:hypothetical protein